MSPGADSLPIAPRATAMPTFAPLFAVGTETVGVRWLTLTYPTAPEILGRILPSPLRPGRISEVGVWVAEFIGAQFNSPTGEVERRPPYMQGGVSVSCDYHGQSGAYAVATFVEGLNHGILGRELFGLPKKQVPHVLLDELGHNLEAGFTTARGVQLMSAMVDLEPNTSGSRPAPEWFDNHFTHKLIPSAEGGGFDISRLVQIPWAFTSSSGTRTGSAKLDWAIDGVDPLYLLEQRGEVAATYGRSVLDIDYGTYREHVADFETFGSPAW